MHWLVPLTQALMLAVWPAARGPTESALVAIPLAVVRAGVEPSAAMPVVEICQATDWLGEGWPLERTRAWTVHVKAEPAAVFALLCDPAGHVAIDSSGMLQSAEGDPVGAVGDTFVVHMDREALNDFPMGRYDVTVEIVTFDRDREIAWTVTGAIRPQIGHVYGYRLEPDGAGTRVTSYYDWSTIAPEWREAGIFPVLSEGALRATLGILARTVAPPT